MTTPDSKVVLDTRGLRCPEPVMMLHRQIRKVEVGEVILVLATDPATQRDIPQFCEFLPHLLLAQANDQGEFQYWIQKGARD
ncbi:sulfurtransferase TusA [Reinekea sp. G2M2-21]|uniref:sulfurtransferase TusA n=1 Tax=Reinekea sp. G2M2-21 TaxID=2788942 RepID=UPI0018A9780C|nr:sulfurtransferase TusA [Reinekea sp. G2M2-21]